MEMHSSRAEFQARPAAWNREAYEGKSTLLCECAMVGWSRFERAIPTLKPHQHRGCYELCFIVRGNVEWWVGPQVFNVGPGDIFVTRPDEPHGGVDTFMHPCQLYWVQLRPRTALLKNMAELGRLCRGGDIIANHFERLLAEHRRFHHAGPRDENQILQSGAAARAVMHLLVIDALRFFAQSQNQLPSPQISRAMQQIHARLESPHALQAAITASGLRGTQFRKRFKGETGFTPQEYLARAQIQQARRRLASSEQSITEIAFDLGFSSSQYFATFFRKLTGLTPLAYRQRYCEVAAHEKQMDDTGE